MPKQIGNYTIKFENTPNIISMATIVGPKEGEGPLSDCFDVILDDVLWGEKTWEKAESKILKGAINLAINKGNLKADDIRYIFAGDLLGQLISSSFALREFDKPFFGLYGACSTMGESLILAAMSIDGGYSNYSVAATSSHFCGAEKEFRYPLEYGSQRQPTTTWTVTGSGAAIISNNGIGPKITYATPGRIIDLGVKDVMNMGAAMAPSAADTIVNHFNDTNSGPENFDLIVTGDLGYVGKELLIDLVKKEGYDIKDKHNDCGIEIFNAKTQKTNCGGSGCGCSAVTLGGYFYPKLKKQEIKKILFIPTGALLSPVSTNEGESIPGIAHGVVIES